MFSAAISRRLTLGVAGNIVGVDDTGLTAIPRAGFLERTDQLGFLGVHADEGADRGGETA